MAGEGVTSVTTQKHLDKYCLVNMNDLLIYSKTLDEHLKHLRAVLQIDIQSVFAQYANAALLCSLR